MSDGKNTVRLSVLIVAHNEADQIDACIKSAEFADEIVVLLDRCTDETEQIAKRLGAKTVAGAWPLEGDRRNAGIESCSGEWILELDADERASQELGDEIYNALSTLAPGCVLIGFDNFIGSHHIKHGWGAYNGVPAKYCLFKKGMKKWHNARVHPPTDLLGEKSALNKKITHFVDSDLSALFRRLISYSDAAARDMVEQNCMPGAFNTGRRFVTRSFKSYVSRGGYREGFFGVALALFSGLYPVLTYLKAKELQFKKGN